MENGVENQIEIVKNLLRIGNFLQKNGNRLTREFGLTQQQFVVLNEVVEKGSVNQTQLVGELLFEKSNVSKIVKKLHSEGLIHVSISSEDARSTVIASTKRGKKVKDECMDRLNRWTRTWLEPMNENDIAISVQALRTLKKLIPSM